MNILAHTSFIGDTGYNNHARSFFTALNKFHNVKVRNYTIGSTWGGYNENCHNNEPYMTSEMREMLILQTLYNNDGSITDYPLNQYKNDFKHDVHIILNDLNHRYFYDNYEGYTIGYNVWETTEYPSDFFNQILKFNEFWVPSEWQKNNLIRQGYPEHKIFVVPEGVDVDTFNPTTEKNNDSIFSFLLFGRWEYRKSTKEIIETFVKTFGEDEPVKLVLSVDNVFAKDNLHNTENRLNHYNLKNKNLEVIHFPKREEYVNYLRKGHVFVSCARSEGWNLPLIEAMACGTPSIYSNWGAQLQFANGLGIPVKTLHEIPGTDQYVNFVGNYIEPDFDDLSVKMREVYENYKIYKNRSLKESEIIRKKFNWLDIAKDASDRLNTIKDSHNKFVFSVDKFVFTSPHISVELKEEKFFTFVTVGNLNYMGVIHKLVKSIQEFSSHKIIVYGVDCDIPFNYPCLIKRKISPPKFSEHDKWYWKQYACIESLNEGYENYVWIDGDVIVNHNIDSIKKYFKDIENYPLSDIHRQEEFYGGYNYDGVHLTQSFNENLADLFNVRKHLPYTHVCLYVYNNRCKWFFEEIIKIYRSIDLKDYHKYLLWNDEGIDNLLRWKCGFTKNLPLSNFDTSSYDGDNGQTNNQLIDFYTFWRKKGPYNFNKIYGYQYIPKDKSDILYFHGNKNKDVSEKMIEFIKLQKDQSFYDSEYFYVEPLKIENLGIIKEIEGSVLDIAHVYGWTYAIYHEIFNLQDYYLDRRRSIFPGDVVVDCGGNIGIFNRFTHLQGASKIISFEPDRRYFELLKLNANPKTILFNAAVSDKVGKMKLYESGHLGGSNIVREAKNTNTYDVRTYNLNYLFETGLVDRIDFLKVDVEGAEILVFDGISDENLMKVRNISMEYHHAHLNFDEEIRNKLISRMVSLGFHPYTLFLGYDNALQILHFWR
jgi:FkbM family methyltransferase